MSGALDVGGAATHCIIAMMDLVARGFCWTHQGE